jgi:hypothetical protein
MLVDHPGALCLQGLALQCSHVLLLSAGVITGQRRHLLQLVCSHMRWAFPQAFSSPCWHSRSRSIHSECRCDTRTTATMIALYNSCCGPATSLHGHGPVSSVPQTA